MIRFASRTRSGVRHPENQDRLAADADLGVFVVADGIGSLADAADTAQVVVDEFPRQVWRNVPVLHRSGLERTVATVAAVATELNERIRRGARSGPGTTGAATALVLVRDGAALIVHLGDSRVYFARGGGFERLTEDHDRDGRLTRFLGMAGEPLPGVAIRDLMAGDRLLVCTDGLTDTVPDDVLGGLLSGSAELGEVCERMLVAAASGEAVDDVSLIVLEFDTGGGGGGGAALRG